MKAWRYSRWDGSQEAFSLDAREALDALSDALMEGLDVEQALEWMRQQGFELAGMDMRVMGTDELIRELQEQADSLYDRYEIESATRELEERLESILDRLIAPLIRPTDGRTATDSATSDPQGEAERICPGCSSRENN